MTEAQTPTNADEKLEALAQSLHTLSQKRDRIMSVSEAATMLEATKDGINRALDILLERDLVYLAEEADYAAAVQ